MNQQGSMASRATNCVKLSKSSGKRTRPCQSATYTTSKLWKEETLDILQNINTKGKANNLDSEGVDRNHCLANIDFRVSVQDTAKKIKEFYHYKNRVIEKDVNSQDPKGSEKVGDVSPTACSCLSFDTAPVWSSSSGRNSISDEKPKEIVLCPLLFRDLYTYLTQLKTNLAAELNFEEEHRVPSKNEAWIESNRTDFDNQLAYFKEFNWDTAKDSDFFGMEANRLKAQALQEYIEKEPALHPKIEEIVCQNAGAFLDSKFLSFVVMKCLPHSKKLASIVKAQVFQDFGRFVNDENRSRVAQSICPQDYLFVDSLLELMSKNLKKYRRSINTIFLVTSCLKLANINGKGFIAFREVLFSEDPAITLSYSRYYKKILIAYIEACPYKDLDFLFFKVFSNRNLIANFFKDFRDKGLGNLFRQFLIRGCQSSVSQFISAFRQSPETHLKNIHFRRFILKILKSPVQYELQFLKALLHEIELYLVEGSGCCFASLLSSGRKGQAYGNEFQVHIHFACYCLLRLLESSMTVVGKSFIWSHDELPLTLISQIERFRPPPSGLKKTEPNSNTFHPSQLGCKQKTHLNDAPGCMFQANENFSTNSRQKNWEGCLLSNPQNQMNPQVNNHNKTNASAESSSQLGFASRLPMKTYVYPSEARKPSHPQDYHPKKTGFAFPSLF